MTEQIKMVSLNEHKMDFKILIFFKKGENYVNPFVFSNCKLDHYDMFKKPSKPLIKTRFAQIRNNSFSHHSSKLKLKNTRYKIKVNIKKRIQKDNPPKGKGQY